jgi:hypothetical protein
MTEPKTPIDPTLLQRVFDRTTISGAGALSGTREIVPRKRITFPVSGEDCAPGMFVDATGAPLEFEITLAALSAAQEIKATRGVLDPTEAVQLMARSSIEKLNGAPVVGEQVEFLWEALGPGGRQLVIVMYQEVGSLSPANLGKARSNFVLG